MMVLVEIESYYKENLSKLIQHMENGLPQLLEIIDKDIDEELSDDKYLNVLKARKQASEDFLWNIKKIGELKKELLGVEEEKEEVTGAPVNLAKKRAQQSKKK
jgi:hypothetical protein